MNNNRILYLDIARIIAVVSMILLHVAAYKWAITPVTSFEWQISNIYDSMVRFCVPLFVMISGALFLNPNKEIPLKQLFQKNIFRIVVAFCFWSMCYSIIVTFFSRHADFSALMPIASMLITRFILGHFHLWFLYMIIGLYLIVPFLKKITADKKLTGYFLILAFIFALVFPALELIPALSKPIQFLVEKRLNMHFVLGFSFYFVAGYYLSHFAPTTQLKKTVYLLGLLSVFFTIILTSYLSIRNDNATGTLYDYLLPNTAFVAMAIFIFLKTNVPKIHFSNKAVDCILHVSKYSFGIYLVHAFFLLALPQINKMTDINPIFSIPLFTAMIFVCSYVAVLVIDRIPILNRFII